MSSLLIRVLVFFIFLLAAFEFGWEFTLSGIILSVVLGYLHWEFLLLGFILDSALLFPSFFFTGIILVMLLVFLAAEEFFKSETIFNLVTKAFLLSALSGIIIVGFYLNSFWPDFDLALSYSAISVLKIFIPIPLLILLFKIREFRGKEAIFQ